MSFTLFSMALIGCVGLAVFKETLTGMKRGFSRSLITLATVLLSAVAAAMLAIWLSDFPVQYLEEWVNDEVPAVDMYADTLPSVPRIAMGALDALLTPVLFIVLFIVIRRLLKGIVALFIKRACRRLADNPSHVGSYISPAVADGPGYVRPDAPWHVRHDRLLGGITSGVCGFLSAIILLSPVLGSFATISRLQRLANEKNFNLQKVGLNGGTFDALNQYFNDGAIAVFNFTGGTLVYNGVATTVLIDDNHVSLNKEIDSCISVTTDMLNAMKILSAKQPLSDEQKAIVSGLGARIDSSDTMKLIATDVVTGACGSWHRNEPFMGMNRPAMGDSIAPVLDGILQVCSCSTHECVGRDITTMLNVYEIILDYGIMNGMSNADFVKLINEGDFLNTLYAELDKNPCMQPLKTLLVDNSLSVVSKAFDGANLTEEQRMALMGQLAEAVNRANAMTSATYEDRLAAVSKDITHYSNQYGVEVTDEFAYFVAVSAMDKSGGQHMTTATMDKIFTEGKVVSSSVPQTNGG